MWLSEVSGLISSRKVWKFYGADKLVDVHKVIYLLCQCGINQKTVRLFKVKFRNNYVSSKRWINEDEVKNVSWEFGAMNT